MTPLQSALASVREAGERFSKLIADVQQHEGEPEAAGALRTLQSTALQTQHLAELLEHELNK